MNVKIKALAFVLMAVLLLCGCGQKSETAAATPAQTVTASAVQSSTARSAWFITLGQSGTTDVRIRHKVFQDCSGVENNNVEVRRFSILG